MDIKLSLTVVGLKRVGPCAVQYSHGQELYQLADLGVDISEGIG